MVRTSHPCLSSTALTQQRWRALQYAGHVLQPHQGQSNLPGMCSNLIKSVGTRSWDLHLTVVEHHIGISIDQASVKLSFVCFLVYTLCLSRE